MGIVTRLKKTARVGDFQVEKDFALLTRRAQGNGLCVRQIFSRYSAFLPYFSHDGGCVCSIPEVAEIRFRAVAFHRDFPFLGSYI